MIKNRSIFPLCLMKDLKKGRRSNCLISGGILPVLIILPITGPHCKNQLKDELEQLLTQQGDPRMLGNGDIFESYPRFGLMRNLPGFKERGKYNPAINTNGLKNV